MVYLNDQNDLNRLKNALVIYRDKLEKEKSENKHTESPLKKIKS